MDALSKQMERQTADFRRTHPWYTPNVEQAHKILCDFAENLDTTERRLAHGELAQALSNLYALRISLSGAIDLLKTGVNDTGEIKWQSIPTTISQN